MAKSTTTDTSTGLLLGLLGIAFIVLKLCKVINWSWWWVLCPFWAGIAVALLILLGFAIAHVIKFILKK